MASPISTRRGTGLLLAALLFAAAVFVPALTQETEPKEELEAEPGFGSAEHAEKVKGQGPPPPSKRIIIKYKEGAAHPEGRTATKELTAHWDAADPHAGTRLHFEGKSTGLHVLHVEENDGHPETVGRKLKELNDHNAVEYAHPDVAFSPQFDLEAGPHGYETPASAPPPPLVDVFEGDELPGRTTRTPNAVNSTFFPYEFRYHQNNYFRGESQYSIGAARNYKAGTPYPPCCGDAWNYGTLRGVPGAWSHTTGSRDVVVAILDTGIDWDHDDLRGNIWTNPGEIPGNGIDDDDNGYIDDVHGVDFTTGSGDPVDNHGHGTWIAGLVGARMDNMNSSYTSSSRRSVGVAPEVSMMALKIFNNNHMGFGGSAGSYSVYNMDHAYASAVIEAMEYALSFGVDISLHAYGQYTEKWMEYYSGDENNWGTYLGGGTHTIDGGVVAGLTTVMEYARQQGQLIVAAAGNQNIDTDTNPFIPAGLPNDAIISVGAADSYSPPRPFSHSNSYSSCRYRSSRGVETVDIHAPAHSLYSSMRGNSYNHYTCGGTSSAAALVAGAAVLLKAYNPSLDGVAMKRALMESTTPLNTYGTPVSATDGYLNVGNAMELVQQLTLPYNEYFAPEMADYQAFRHIAPGTNLAGVPGGSVADFTWETAYAAHTPGTGPANPYMGSAFLLADATGNFPARTAAFETWSFDIEDDFGARMTFTYNMNGDDMGRLVVDVFDGSSWKVNVWNKVGNQGPAWHEAVIDLTGDLAAMPDDPGSYVPPGSGDDGSDSDGSVGVFYGLGVNATTATGARRLLQNSPPPPPLFKQKPESERTGATRTNMRVRFRATTGSSMYSDVAIGSIVIVPGKPCPHDEDTSDEPSIDVSFSRISHAEPCTKGGPSCVDDGTAYDQYATFTVAFRFSAHTVDALGPDDFIFEGAGGRVLSTTRDASVCGRVIVAGIVLVDVWEQTNTSFSDIRISMKPWTARSAVTGSFFNTTDAEVSARIDHRTMFRMYAVNTVNSMHGVLIDQPKLRLVGVFSRPVSGFDAADVTLHADNHTHLKYDRETPATASVGLVEPVLGTANFYHLEVDFADGAYGGMWVSFGKHVGDVGASGGLPYGIFETNADDAFDTGASGPQRTAHVGSTGWLHVAYVPWLHVRNLAGFQMAMAIADSDV